MIDLGTKRAVKVIAGLPRYGKGTFMVRYLLNADLSVRFIYDPEPGEFRRDINEFADRLKLEPTVSPFDLAKHLVTGWVAFDPHTLFTGQPDEGLDFFCDWAWHKGIQIPGRKAVVIDEVYRYCSPNYIPDGLKNLAFSGSKHDIELFLLSQEPNRLHSSIKTAMSEIVCFRLQDKGLDFAQDNGFNRDEIANLPPLHFVALNKDSGGWLRGRIAL